MPWFVKIETGIVDKAIFDQFVPAHKEYVQGLIQAGYQAKTGYWRERGGGMMLFQAPDRQTAEQIVQQDPLIRHRCVDYVLHEWCVVME
ncbi:MAG: YciI family protein [Elainella sp. Prado103]|jgi:hypothetical protein|nr:YciI family protein [Elainella sp. Prado103]